MSNFPIPRLQQIAATIEESGADIFDAPATAVHYIECAIKEIERLRAERDEARREVCNGEAIIRLQRNRVHRDSEEVVLKAKEISVERGWDCFKENTDYLQDLG
jgi:hypothetical protein